MTASREKAEKGYLTVLASALGVFALIALTSPATLLSPTEIAITSPSAFAELRATYFGSFLALAIVFSMGARRARYRRVAIGLAALLLCCFSAGRFLSLLVDGPANPFSTTMHVMETNGGLLGLFFWWRSRASRASAPADEHSLDGDA